MRRHRIIFLAAITCATGCPTSKKEIETAKHSVFDTEFAVVYAAALEVTRQNYPNLEDAPGRGSIKTAWHQVSYANNQDDLANPRTLANAQGINGSTQVSPNQAAAGMPTRLAYKRYFVRFDVSIAGGRPWRLKVVGHAAEWEPGATLPTELHGVARPSWLEGRTDSLRYAIYKRLKAHAIAVKENEGTAEDPKRADPALWKDVPPGAAKRLAALKDALSDRDYTALRAQLAEDVVWSLGGGTGADAAMAMWQADPEPLDAMSKVLAAGCGGDAKKVTCPAAPPAPAAYQLTLEVRGEAWQITGFVKAE
ncbi:MAG TPA: hypothetical protein VHN14_15915 [Kofleriaceae bacterium]|jgi:hypothetical protein|nr:hypothetical protein [Kofleriaceae bacterium]